MPKSMRRFFITEYIGELAEPRRVRAGISESNHVTSAGAFRIQYQRDYFSAKKRLRIGQNCIILIVFWGEHQPSVAIRLRGAEFFWGTAAPSGDGPSFAPEYHVSFTGFSPVSPLALCGWFERIDETVGCAPQRVARLVRFSYG
jgi:hypothetical protein